MAKEGFDKSFASPADYDDGFVESDAARWAREEAIKANVNAKKNKEQKTTNTTQDLKTEDLAKKSKNSKSSLVLHKKPITVCSTNLDANYSDYYWTCKASERQDMLKRMWEYDYTEDDYDNNGYELQVTERDEMKPSKDKFYAISDFIEQTGFDRKDIIDPTMVDTGRYLKINYYKNGIPDRTDGRYNDPYDKSNQPYAPDATMIVYESVPRGEYHEFWRVDEAKSKSSIFVVDDEHFEIEHKLTPQEASKYVEKRDSMAYSQQVNKGILPKSVNNLFAMRDKADEEQVDNMQQSNNRSVVDD